MARRMILVTQQIAFRTAAADGEEHVGEPSGSPTVCYEPPAPPDAQRMCVTSFDPSA